jgi:DNA-binding GntR family transcriptional regulator
VSQEALVDELDVSTTPLREAMRRLSAGGPVVLDADRDARVAPLTASEARSPSRAGDGWTRAPSGRPPSTGTR